MESAGGIHLPVSPAPPNGFGAAAVLSAGIGSIALAVFAIAADRSPAFRRIMAFYKPTGPLSGVTTSAIAVWLLVWLSLHLRWRNRNVRLPAIMTTSIVLLILAFLLMFPPIADLF